MSGRLGGGRGGRGNRGGGNRGGQSGRGGDGTLGGRDGTGGASGRYGGDERRRGQGGRGSSSGRGDGRGSSGGRGGGRGGRLDVRVRGGRADVTTRRGSNEEPHPQLQVLTNMIPATVSETFSFYRYTIDAVDANDEVIDSRSRRMELFRLGFYNGVLSGLLPAAQKELGRVVFFAGSFFFAAREIPGLSHANLPYTLVDGSTTNGDTMRCMSVTKFTTPTCLVVAPQSSETQGHVRMDPIRCAHCTRTFSCDSGLLQHCRDTGHSPIFAHNDDMVSEPASADVFVSYVSLALDRAMSEDFVRWGKEFVFHKAPTPAVHNGKALGVSIFEAMSLSLGLVQHNGAPPQLVLTCDLRAKVIRTDTVRDEINRSCGSLPGKEYSSQEQERLREKLIGTVVIYNFKIRTRFLFRPKSKGMSHAEYFKKKGVTLKWPSEKPMIEVEGRHQSKIYLPAELVSGNELDPKVREMLPRIASFEPHVRNEAINKIKTLLRPGTQSGTGGTLLPAIGVILSGVRIVAAAKVLPAPALMAAGVQVPNNFSEYWAPYLGRASFDVDPRNATQLNVVVFYHTKIQLQDALTVFERIRDLVNSWKTYYRFPTKPYPMVEAGDFERHLVAFKKHFVGKIPANLFVLEFVKPPRATDPAYPVIKQMLAKSGYLSQFVSFKTCAHDESQNMKKSDIILKGVARQILQKAGFEIWWARIPDSLPLPAMFIGVDVFHAPMVYDLTNKKRGRKASCAAIVITVVRKIPSGPKKVEAFSKTYSRTGGKEYQLGDALEETVDEAKRILKVEPKSVVVWRDGMPETAEAHANEEISGVYRGLKKSTVGVQAGPTSDVQLAYIVCQKRITTKFLTLDGDKGAPSGTMVGELQGMHHQTFYINGRAPSNSTAKPVRFLCIRRDTGLLNVPLGELTWAECHNYPNWTGPVKVPAVCQMAHKLAELAGSFRDGEGSINYDA